MNRLSIRTKITLWFTAALIIVVALTYVCILGVGRQVVQKTVRDNLIETVENNVDEIEYRSAGEETAAHRDVDLLIPYGEGSLEVDDDFLDSVNGVYTALYDSHPVMLYGENPIAAACAALPLTNNVLQRLKVNGVLYYVFDRELTGEGLKGLWLRGVVAETQGKEALTTVTLLSLMILPLIVAVAVIGGSLIAKRALSPIRRIADTASLIRRGRDLKKRIELEPGTDELHQLSDTFNEMFERLEESFDKERRFTSDVSHELRTPMAVIMARCEYSMEQDKTADAYAESVGIIYQQGKRMTNLINRMLDMARLEMRPENYPLAPTDMSELVRSACFDLALIRDKGIILTSDIEEGITLSGNGFLLNRAVSNLILNAYRYGREGGYIRVSLRREGKDVLLTVADDGIGISPEDQKRIFDRFFRADSSRSEGGSGLGLALSKEIAEFHGGRITVESALGEGSTFTLVLPGEK